MPGPAGGRPEQRAGDTVVVEGRMESSLFSALLGDMTAAAEGSRSAGPWHVRAL